MLSHNHSSTYCIRREQTCQDWNALLNSLDLFKAMWAPCYKAIVLSIGSSVWAMHHISTKDSGPLSKARDLVRYFVFMGT